jgi:hypothetical protein
MHMGHYVQVRYPQGGRWVTVAVSDTRESAATVAANAYRERHDPRGQTPSQVRIVSAAQLVREGGEQELRIADAELIGAAKREGLERREIGGNVNRRAG